MMIISHVYFYVFIYPADSFFYTLSVQNVNSPGYQPDPPARSACCLACGCSSLRSMADTPSVVTPCRLASGTLQKARGVMQPMTHMRNKNLMVDLGLKEIKHADRRDKTRGL